MPEFSIIRLGKDSIPAINQIDATDAISRIPFALKVSCSQVPVSVTSGCYAFLYLGSDNSKGLPTNWGQGLRALGIIVTKEGGIRYADRCELTIEVKVVFQHSISKIDFVKKTPQIYYWFSGMPVIGINSYSNQTVQQIKQDDPTQNISALFKALGVIQDNFRLQAEKYYPDLGVFFDFEPIAEIEPKEINAVIDSEKPGEDLSENARTGPTDEVEGFDSADVTGWGDYSLDSVFVRTEQRTISEVVKRIRADRFVLNPDFQRDFIWSKKKQSKLIESCLMRIPLPVFYVAEAKDGRIIVVDGLQRLTTFTKFLNNEFALDFGPTRENQKQENFLATKKFNNLNVTLQERIEDTQLTLYILDARAPERAKLDIFDRVNNGEPLSRQQMRNCLFNGPATAWLKLASKMAAFINATEGSLNTRSMRDREAINRFCAFRLLTLDAYIGDMDHFLANALEKMNTLGKSELENLTREFEKSMNINFFLFGKHAFRKSLANTEGSDRKVINIALFDVCSVLFANSSEESVQKYASQLRDVIRGLLDNEIFNHTISSGTNDVVKVQTRFCLMNQAIEPILKSC